MRANVQMLVVAVVAAVVVVEVGVVSGAAKGCEGQMVGASVTSEGEGEA